MRFDVAHTKHVRRLDLEPPRSSPPFHFPVFFYFFFFDPARPYLALSRNGNVWRSPLGARRFPFKQIVKDCVQDFNNGGNRVQAPPLGSVHSNTTSTFHRLALLNHVIEQRRWTIDSKSFTWRSEIKKKDNQNGSRCFCHRELCWLVFRDMNDSMSCCGRIFRRGRAPSFITKGESLDQNNLRRFDCFLLFPSMPGHNSARPRKKNPINLRQTRSLSGKTRYHSIQANETR